MSFVMSLWTLKARSPPSFSDLIQAALLAASTDSIDFDSDSLKRRSVLLQQMPVNQDRISAFGKEH